MSERSQESLSDPRKPVVSIIVPTRNRVESMTALLKSLDELRTPAVPYEIIVVDNGSCDDTPRVLSKWAERQGSRRVLRVEQPGKARALNAGVTAARGELLVFLDDDVVVDPSHLVEAWDYFSKNDCAAAQGTVAWPREAVADPELRELLRHFRSNVPRVEPLPGAKWDRLVGTNMVVRRDVLLRAGPFDERLGPGATGLGEDDDLSDRILRCGGWIGSMPAVCVTHEIDRARLTEEYFRQRQRLAGRSHYLQKRRGLVTNILPDLFKAACDYVFYSLLGNVSRKYRAKGRCYYYWEMFDMVMQRMGSRLLGKKHGN